MAPHATVRSLVAGAVILSSACSSSMMDTELATQLLSVSPRGGTTNVVTSSDIVLTFDQPMMAGMEQYLALHQGAVTGATMPMGCNWSNAQRTLTCRSSQPLASATRYVIHMGGGMMDANGLRVGMESSGVGMGGQWVGSGMMTGQASMMGNGWKHTNGSYGMAFEFTTK